VENGMTPTDQLVRTAPPSRRHGQHNNSHAELQRQIERLTARVKQLESDKESAENFAALAAHELVSPLVMAEACAALATERANTTDIVEALEILGRGAARTRRLVESLLHEARAGGRPMRAEVVDLDELAHDCIAMLQPEIEARSAEVVLDPLPGVRGEPELLSGLLTNLLVNALKYNPRQGGTIRIGAAAADDWCEVFVESEGPVIPPEDRTRIFEPYHRGRGERRVKGVGLGLAICRRIVERHGGTIGVTGVGASGNRFAFSLPAA
jgi:signal transduction histidine kinase